MFDVAGFQRQLYEGAVAALNAFATGGIEQLPAMIVAAFGFGLAHALLPGHGKTLLASYYAGAGRWRGAVLSSAIAIATHVSSAIVIVLAGFEVLDRTIGTAGREPAIELASRVLIVAIGLWLLWRALRPHDRPVERSGPALGFVSGLVPCPLTTFTMTYASIEGAIGAGLVLSACFAAGMIVTVALFPLLAVLLRTRALLIVGTQRWRRALGRGLEIAAAVAVVAVGAWPLLG